MHSIRAVHLPSGHRDTSILRVHHLLSWWSLAFLLLALPGCSVAMALKQPEKKNLNILNPGTPRAMVIKELGLPTRTDEYRGEKVDAFTISEGYSREAKMLRAGLHLTADGFTFGLWEPFGIVLERSIRPPDISLEVHYDAYDRVTNLKVLSNDNIVLAKSPPEAPPTAAFPPIVPTVVPVLMPQPITEAPQRLAVILPQGPHSSFISSGLDLVLTYLRTFHPTMTIVERDRLGPVTQELVLQHMGKVQDDTMARIGGWRGADTLLIVQIEQTSADRLQTVAQRGGEVAHSVEIRLAQVETGLVLFRQTTLARVKVSPPSGTQSWPDELLDDARRETLRVAYTHSLAALAAAFGDNPLGLVPDMSSRSEGIRLLGLLHGGPGHRAGLQEGDRILEVDGVPYSSVTQRITLPTKLLVEQRNERKDVLVEARGLGR
ncbi:MAG: PDZ domain-containing protein [Nitrospirae bacterium]|nr:PDZ domain-containing protein [Nitrospirota bacterium]